MSIQYNEGRSRVERIKMQVALKAAKYVEHLYPRRTQIGDQWRIGDKHGTRGQSLAITLSGPFAGCGYDFATEESFRDYRLDETLFVGKSGA